MSAETMMKQIAAESRAGAKATLTSGACTEATGPHVSLDQYDTVIAATTNEELNKRDIFGDGDQSFLQHRGPQDVNAQALKNMWVAGGDFLMLANAGRLGAFMLNCFRGKHEQVANSLAKAGAAGGEAMYQLLARRETLLRWTPLDGAIYGALQMGNHDGAKHAKVAKLLLEAGANADAKDVCGSTPLLRCTTCAATEILLDIGMLLIDRGANANSRNRFGETALMEAVSSNCTDCVMLLCEGGADPMIASTDDAERCPFKNPLLALPTRSQVSEVLGHAISRKSVTGSWQLTGKQVTLHGLSRKDLNGKKGICGRLNPIKLRYAIQIMDDDGQEEQVMLIQIKNIRVTKTSLQGQRVILKGLGNEAMNGRQGLAGEFHEKRERWAVTLDGDTVSIAVKQTNLEMIPHVYTCEHCGVKAPKMSKCKKCFKTYFCSSACIKTGFDAHKAQCLGWREGQVRLDGAHLRLDGAHCVPDCQETFYMCNYVL
mmetsp:Transcript_66534/g.97335  ORF Transcript_66534/g.97335 Transcript_66534/m.97335 type:complete len:487 (+) Transcript_66534:221-1681(+)